MKKRSVIITMLIFVLLNLFQLFGYVNPFTRFFVVAIPNEETAITHARITLMTLDKLTDECIFITSFSWRTRSWSVNVLSSYNNFEIIHYFEFKAITGQVIHENVNIE